MLSVSPEGFAEEFAIHDYEGFEGVQVSEYSEIVEVHELACFIVEHGKLGAGVLEYYGGDLEEAREALSDRYCGCYSSLADYAQSIIEETPEVPDHLARYIDYERMGRDMEPGGDVLAIETGFKEVRIFWPD